MNWNVNLTMEIGGYSKSLDRFDLSFDVVDC
jgi:rRNA maturation endonuclease Nob1